MYVELAQGLLRVTPQRTLQPGVARHWLSHIISFSWPSTYVEINQCVGCTGSVERRGTGTRRKI